MEVKNIIVFFIIFSKALILLKKYMAILNLLL